MRKPDIILAEDETPIEQILDHLGIPYRAPPSQMKCPIHSGGNEQSPSARLHTDNRVFCFTCTRQMTGVDIWAAVQETTKDQAAKQILELFPPAAGRRAALIKQAANPPPPDRNQYLEEVLLQYRGTAPLQIYRKAALYLDTYETDTPSHRKDPERALAQLRAILRTKDPR